MYASRDEIVRSTYYALATVYPPTVYLYGKTDAMPKPQWQYPNPDREERRK
jgi:hypothetical protein